MRVRSLLLFIFLLLPCAFADNQPTFNYYGLGISAQVSAITTDAAGNTYLTGSSTNLKIDATPGAFQPQGHDGICGYVAMIGFVAPCYESFVIKLNPFGEVVFATYLGGSGDDIAYGIAVDQQGNVYVAGSTSQNPIEHTNTFPVTSGAAFTDPANASGFIVKLNPTGTKLVYATFIPGIYVRGLALDRDANVYFTGTNSSFLGQALFPATDGAYQPPPGSTNMLSAVAGKLNVDGSALSYGAYLACATPSSIAVDSGGNAFIAGTTICNDFPVTSGAFLTKFPGTSPGDQSVFLSKLNPQGTGLVYSTYLGLGDTVKVRVDAHGTALLSGRAMSPKFPTVGVQAFPYNPPSGFLTHVSADGSSLIYSTYVPTDNGQMDADSAGNAVIMGDVTGGGLPTGAGAFQTDFGGTGLKLYGLYIARIAPDGRFAGGTYLGNSLENESSGPIALAPNGSVVIEYVGSRAGPCFIGPCSGRVVSNLFPFLTIENAGSYVAAPIAPGEIVALRGYGIGPDPGVSAIGSSLPKELGGVFVSFGGYQAPLFYAGDKQINAQVPWELAGSTSTTVQVSYPGVNTISTPVAMTPTLPGIFYINNSDGTRNSPTNPAKPGDYISIYGTGGGQASPSGVTGEAWPQSTQLTLLTASTSVTIADKNAQVAYAGASPLNSSGFFQINAVLPTDLQSSSNAVLSLTIGTASAAGVPIAIGAR
jgi:uncharacterized protein (TIGR03437 family)